MRTTLRRLRPLFIGLVALLFTAGIAFAGKPSAAPVGRTVAGEAAGKTVPVVAEPGDEQEADGDEDTETDTTTEDPADTADNCTTDPTGLTAEELAAMTHGSIVCWAAHQATPEGYANHGAWVSEWAKANNGADKSTAAGGASAAAKDKATAAKDKATAAKDKAAAQLAKGKSRKP
ncbi:MAG: hypothetical protein HYX57_03175 [Chloroflexi bacterium]|nr:hypothetical protein [Chloroflexota bacterium]